MSLVEITAYEDQKRYIDSYSYTRIRTHEFKERKVVFDVDNFSCYFFLEKAFVMLGGEITEVVSKFFDNKGLKCGALYLIEAEKDEFGEPFVWSYIKSIKINGSEIFNINDYEVHLYLGNYSVNVSLSPKNRTELDIRIQSLNDKK